MRLYSKSARIKTYILKIIKSIKQFRRILLLMILLCFIFCPIQKLSLSKDFISQLYLKESRIKCHWYFLNYTPSNWENLWYDNVEAFQNNVCERLSYPENLNNTISAMLRLMELQEFGRNKTKSDYQYADELFSKMFYREECFDPVTHISFVNADMSHLIEPLIGLLRDPFTMCKPINSTVIPPIMYSEPDSQSKRFLSVSVSAPIYFHRDSFISGNKEIHGNDLSFDKKSLFPWMYQRSYQKNFEEPKNINSPKHILFDLGSSYFGSWGNVTRAAAGAWFYQYYKRFNIKFDRIIAFELESLDPKRAWDEVPADVVPVYTFINTGVTIDGKFNPWNILRAVAQPSDYVIVKIDIDHFQIEDVLINQILNDNEIQSLIDELFFEHHVNVTEMFPYWGPSPAVLKDSYVLFRKMRQLGIWMHSWP